MQWEELRKLISEATLKFFCDLRETHTDEDFYAYALYTDSSAMTVLPSVNSTQKLQQIIEKAEDKTLSSLAYYKWATSEWAYEGGQTDGFREISKKLRNSADRECFDQFKQKVLQTMIAALKALDEDGVFGTGVQREQVVLFITIVDDNDAEKIENESAKLLNPFSIYDIFIRRYEV
jgi:uncharacterized membrane protein YebE (DUF533 family)